MRPDEADDGRRQVSLQIATSDNAPAEVMFDECKIGSLNYGCQLPPIDIVAFANACGADGFYCERPEEIHPALSGMSSRPSPALVKAVVDPEEKPGKLDELRA